MTNVEAARADDQETKRRREPWCHESVMALIRSILKITDNGDDYPSERIAQIRDLCRSAMDDWWS